MAQGPNSILSKKIEPKEDNSTETLA
jgi:hypothetical protein